MGFRRNRYITIIFLFLIIGTTILGEETLKVKIIDEDKINNFALEVIKIFIGALPSIGLAWYAARKERKQREKFEKDNISEKEKVLKLEWYNNLVLGKVVEAIRDYYTFIEEELEKIDQLNSLEEKRNKIIEFTNFTREKRETVRSYLGYIKLFNHNLYKECQVRILKSVDVNSSEDLNEIENSIIVKKRQNNSSCDEILKLLYEYVFKI